MKSSSNKSSLAITGITHDCVAIGEVSITIDQAMTFTEWKKLGASITQLQESSLFWLGDWLNAGQRIYGTKYREALTVLGDKYEYQSLVNIAYICNNVQPELRRRELTYSHHREVCKLSPDKQRDWLERAVEEEWSVSELRRHIRGAAELRASTKRAPESVGIGAVVNGFKAYSKQTLSADPPIHWDRDRVVAVMRDLEPLAEFYVQLQQRLKAL